VEVLRIDPHDPDPAVVSRAVSLLRAGNVIAGPSDTVYGFLALPVPRALATLSALKGRDGPYILLVADWSSARAATADVVDATWKRIGRVWPGPVTVVLPAPGGRSVALRMPKTTLLVKILEGMGEPLVSTSANPAGRAAPISAEDVLGAFPQDAVPLLLDGGNATSRDPSTLVDLTGAHARILREGRGDARPLLDPPPATP
jgi:L-threonylcarbamoyladenylate synthase